MDEAKTPATLNGVMEVLGDVIWRLKEERNAWSLIKTNQRRRFEEELEHINRTIELVTTEIDKLQDAYDEIVNKG